VEVYHKFTASFYTFLRTTVHVVILHEHKVYQAQHLDTVNNNVIVQKQGAWIMAHNTLAIFMVSNDLQYNCGVFWLLGCHKHTISHLLSPE